MAGVNKVQTTKLVKAGKLTAGKGGHLDTGDKKNAAYLKAHMGAKPDNDSPDRVDYVLQKIQSEIRRNNETADEKLQKRLERMGLLVERELFRKRMAVLDGEIKRRFLELSQRAGPDLHAKAQSMGVREWELELEKEISEALTAVVAAVQDAGA